MTKFSIVWETKVILETLLSENITNRVKLQVKDGFDYYEIEAAYLRDRWDQM